MEGSVQFQAPVTLPIEKEPGTHWIGNWIGPISGLDVLKKRKISCPYRESNPGQFRPWCSFCADYRFKLLGTTETVAPVGAAKNKRQNSSKMFAIVVGKYKQYW
jgi:hypothetical protein